MSGEQQWSESVGSQTSSLAVDNHNNILTGTGPSAGTVYYFEQEVDEVTERWSYAGAEGDSSRGLSVDTDNNFYVGNWSASSAWKFRDDGAGGVETVWEYSWSASSGRGGLAATRPWGTEYVAIGDKDYGVHLVEEDGNGNPQAKWVFDTEPHYSIPNTRDVVFTPGGDMIAVGNGGEILKLTDVLDDSPTLSWSIQVGDQDPDNEPSAYSGSVPDDGSIYIAGGDGYAYKIVEDGAGNPVVDWSYEHSDPTQSTDKFDYLLHSIAVRKDGSEIYSTSYDETVHKIVEIDGSPTKEWEFDGHTDHVREVAMYDEHHGPEE